MTANLRFSNSIILPSENQTREFDGKLLQACVLAEKGFNVIVGARHAIHNHIARLPKSIYIAKDFRQPSERILSIIEKLGHCIVAWDEEGLVQPKPQLYYDRRYTKAAISHVQQVFAWGPANKTLMLGAPDWPGLPIHNTGNPRIDLLRPELRGFHAEAVAAIKARHGRFVLFDSNFASFNPAVKSVAPVLAQLGEAHSSYIESRRRLFERWQKLLPDLAEQIAPTRLVIRPHPAEDHSLWLALAKGSETIDVIHEGSALPWILAAEVMLHSSCTTGVEAYVMARACLSFQPDEALWDLPDKLSVVVSSENDLIANVKAVMEGQNLKLSDSHKAVAEQAMFALRGPLAVDRIAAVLQGLAETPGVFSRRLFTGYLEAKSRHIQKRFTALLPGHKTSKSINKLRYPGVSLQEIAGKVQYLAQVLQRFKHVRVQEVEDQIYRVSRQHY
jgi:surface carbohydrate biosynthesis protein